MATLLAELKQERSTLKKKITQVAKRVEGAIRRTQTSDIINKFLMDLEELFSDFVTAHEDYVEIVESDAAYEEHNIVNGLNCEDYLHEVTHVYEMAKAAYETYSKTKRDKETDGRCIPIVFQIQHLSDRLRTKLSLVDECLNSPNLYSSQNVSLLSSQTDDLEPMITNLLDNKAKLMSIQLSAKIQQISDEIDVLVSQADKKKDSVYYIIAKATQVDEAPVVMSKLPASTVDMHNVVQVASIPSLPVGTVNVHGVDLSTMAHSLPVSTATAATSFLSSSSTSPSVVTSGVAKQIPIVAFSLPDPQASQVSQVSAAATSVNMYPHLTSSSNVLASMGSVQTPIPSYSQGGIGLSSMSSVACPVSGSTVGGQPSMMHATSSLSRGVMGGPPPMMSQTSHIPGGAVGGMPTIMPITSHIPGGAVTGMPTIMPITSHIPGGAMGGLFPMMPAASILPSGAFSSMSSMYPANPMYAGMYGSLPPTLPSSIHPYMTSHVMPPTVSSPLPSTFTSVAAPGYPIVSSHPISSSGHFGARHDEFKIRKLELPKFSGKRKDWPEFKAIWPKLAVPSISCREALASELRKSLSKTAQDKISSISIVGPEAYDLMWSRLCEFYDDQAANVEAAMEGLQKLVKLEEGDYKGLVHLADEVESAYSQLEILGQLNSLTQRDVDFVSRLLPLSTKSIWSRQYRDLSDNDRLKPFPCFKKFLVNERYTFRREAELQQVKPKNHKYDKPKRTETNHGISDESLPTETNHGESDKSKPTKYYPCASHPKDGMKHISEHCSDFKKLRVHERLAALKSIGACFRCFGDLADHRRADCKLVDPCNTCGKTNHHHLMCRKLKYPKEEKKKSDSNAGEQVTDSNSSNGSQQSGLALYAINQVPVVGSNKKATVFSDGGSNSVYITHRAAKRFDAKKLKKYKLEVRTTGGTETTYETQEYEVELRTQSGRVVPVRAYGMDKITGKLSRLSCSVLAKLFPGYDPAALQRTSTEVDILLGSNYFGLHPKHEVCAAGQNLSIMKGELGLCVVGSHPELREETQIDVNMVQVLHNAYISTSSHHSRSLFGNNHPEFHYHSKLDLCRDVIKTSSCVTRAEDIRIANFIEGEELTTQVIPRCGSCKCSKCPSIGHTYSFQEESELKLIRENLRYDHDQQCWITKYPWKVNPSTLPDNYGMALATMKSTEAKLVRDRDMGKVYQEQIQDMLDRQASRKLSQEEIKDWNGPVFHICHLVVKNPKSESTPCRIVFNSSQEYKGVSLNGSLYKGPDAYLNNLVGLLLRWREEQVALVGDIRKMFNSVHLEIAEQHCHRFLWRELDSSREPDIYVMTRVNMGDKPAGAISTEAVYKTADLFESDSPHAANFLKQSSYVDDLLDSMTDKACAVKLSNEAEEMLMKGGFNVKFWLYSGDKPQGDDVDKINRVLGIGWKSENDLLVFQVSLNFSHKRQGIHVSPDITVNDIPSAIPAKLTRRIVLAQVMRIYDPLGILSPFTLHAKVYLRETWALKLEWDESLPADLRNKWIHFFTTLFEIEHNLYPRCLRPSDSIGDPWLVILSDGSDTAYGFAAYVRWKLQSGEYDCRLVMSKCRIAPLNKVTTPQMELNAAVLSKRGRKVIEGEMRYTFEKVLQLVDSETVLCMINKLSTRFKLYYGVRLGEIQSATEGDVSCWAWMSGEDNTADWLTRGRDPAAIGPLSEWWKGPNILYKPIEEWGLKFGRQHEDSLPGEKNIHKAVESNLAEAESGMLIDYERFQCIRKVIRVIAYVMDAVRRFRRTRPAEISPQRLHEAERLIIVDTQRTLHGEMNITDKKRRVGGKYALLRPVKNEAGVWIIGCRLSYNPMTPEGEAQALLPTKHPVTRLFMVEAHRSSGHRGRDTTLARFRWKYWTPHGTKLAWSVKKDCQMCKLRDHALITQQMGRIPECRLKPSPPFSHTMLDLFGPYKIRGEIQKRTSGKGYGVIFTDMVMRAIHIEAVFGYDTGSFLMGLSRFVSLRGYPSQIYSDPGSQLIGADRELQEAWAKMDRSLIRQKGAEFGLEWNFGPGDSPWHQGAVESLIKGVKRSLRFCMGDQHLSASEFLTVCTEVANMVNERPIGIQPGLDSTISLLTPNSLLMGRCSAKNPGGWQPDSGKLIERYAMVQDIVDLFWKNWRELYAPTLVWQSKWHHATRNLEIGDIVVVADSDTLKSDYRLAVVRTTFPGTDGIVRKVAIAYKNFKIGEKLYEYSGAPDVLITRGVQRLSLLVPVHDS